jgi:hypothetical protein
MADAIQSKWKGRFAAARRYGLAGLLFVFAGIHAMYPAKVTVDWPTVALLAIALAVCFMPQLRAFIPHVKSLKVGSAQIEMRELTTNLAESVTKTEESIPPIEVSGISEASKENQLKRLANTDIEAHIADLSAKDKQAALLRLSVELEKELLVLHGELGLRNDAKGILSFRELVVHLRKFGAINAETERSLLEFRTVRNEIAHAVTAYSSAILTSAIDSGIRLLRVIRAVPREKHTVLEPAVAVYSDARCQNRIARYVGVLIESTGPDGTRRRQVYPAGREFKQGEIVGWDWDRKSTYGPAYWHDPETGECREAWTGSLAFIGKANPPQADLT